jgi:hypothetical protein
MPNPHRYFIEERNNGTLAVIGEGKDKPARVVNTEPGAEKKAHHYAGRGGVVEFKDEHGKFTHCLCPRCKANRSM